MSAAIAVPVPELEAVAASGSAAPSPAAPAATPPFRVRPIMKQGTASSIPEAWARFPTVQDARDAVKKMYHNDRVMRAMIVTDEAPPRFVEWVER